MELLMVLVTAGAHDIFEGYFTTYRGDLRNEQNKGVCQSCIMDFKDRQFVINLPCLHLHHLDCMNANARENRFICSMCKVSLRLKQ